MYIQISQTKKLGPWRIFTSLKYSIESHCAEREIQSEKGERKESKVSDDPVYETGRENRSAKD